jgi:predicted outer membrane protein
MVPADKLALLAAAKGGEFDDLFLKYMIRHHQGALTMSGTSPPTVAETNRKLARLRATSRPIRTSRSRACWIYRARSRPPRVL